MSYQLIERSLQHHYSCLSKSEERINHPKSPLIVLQERHKRQKKDFRIINGGDNGNGKSSLSCRYGEINNPKTFIDNPEWAVDNQIHFFAKNWLKAVSNLDMYDINCYDEPAQSGGHHREFMSEANIIITKTVATVRFKRLIIPVNIPFIDMLDKDLRKLCQVYIYCYDQGRAEVFRIMNPKFGGEPWYEKIIDEFRWGMPNDKLWDLYFKKKECEEGDVYQKYENKLEKRERDQRSDEDIIEHMYASDQHIRDESGAINITNLMAEVSIGRDRASRLRRKYEREIEDNQNKS